MPQHEPAILVLKNGTVFRGISIGATGHSVGEVVFNTSMTGYQEILTDPSYCRQIVTLTYPHIGNTGTNDEDQESGQVYSAGLVIRDLPMLVSNWRAKQSLGDFLKANNVVGIAGIDTRKLTRILREKGAQNGALMAGRIDEAKALEAARAFPGLAGMDLPTWYAAVAPSGTPQPVLAKLNADIARVLAMPEVKKKLGAIGLDPRPSTPAYVDDLTKAEIAKWGVLVKEAGLLPE